MASLPLLGYEDRILETDAATVVTGQTGGATPGGEVKPPHQRRRHSPDHLLGFDGTHKVSFHPATQFFERTERRHTSSRSIFSAGVAKGAIETYEAGNPRVKGKDIDHPCTVWVGAGDELSPAELDKLERGA
jgi:hypothetical protein